MKTLPDLSAPWRAAVTLLLFALAVWLGTARTSASDGPPNKMTYQGFLVDGDGQALGSPNPKNYDVIFRIFNDELSNAEDALLWDEQQTVTVDKGYFSVLLGEGAPSTPDKHPDIPTLFTGADASERYVGVTVVGIGTGGGNVDILPRLRLLTSPYAFLAGEAVSAKLAVEALTARDVDGASLSSGTVADARLSANVALRTGGNTFSGTQNYNANIGLIRSQGGNFTTAVEERTHLELHHGQNPTTGWSYRFNTGVDQGGAPWFKIEAPTDGAGNSAEKLRIVPGGVTLSGRATISGPLDVFGTYRQSGDIVLQNGNILFAKNSAGALEQVFTPRWTDNKTYLNYGSAGLVIRNSTLVEKLTMDASGTVNVTGGGLQAGGKNVAVGEESLRIVRGNVERNGTNILAGSGFSVAKSTASGEGQGYYKITFSPAFSGVPTVTANNYNYDTGNHNRDNYITVEALTASGVKIISRDVGGEGFQDSHFTFVAIGPR